MDIYKSLHSGNFLGIIKLSEEDFLHLEGKCYNHDFPVEAGSYFIWIDAIIGHIDVKVKDIEVDLLVAGGGAKSYRVIDDYPADDLQGVGLKFKVI
jgi:hypothetical protein